MMKPIGNHAIVEKIAHRVSASMIWSPQLAEENYGGVKLARVIAVGPGRRTRKGVTIPFECQAGDRILIHSYYKGPAELGNGRFMISSDEIIAVLPSEQPRH